jgi:lipopolysaccharide/colanic/teichoic acid biosynthesis glycosyltransferase
MGKRLFDVCCAGLALVVLWPLMLVIALVVTVESPGPAIFRQIRVGRNGHEFEVLKFRTMRVATRGDAPQITVAGDARITRTGRFIRATKLDELPQLLNVLRGDMSLVGPRPEVPKYVALYPPEVRDIILSVRPGITDVASIRFRSESEILARSADPERTYVQEILPQKLRLYESYARHHGVASDIGILARTLFAVVSRRVD